MLMFLPTFSLIVGAWSLVNGILHDIFILRSDHGKQYDRNLLRLLMDGHILMTCGAMQMISSLGFKNDQSWSYYIAGVSCISLLVYCGMIFPFLKNVVTPVLNLSLLTVILIDFFK